MKINLSEALSRGNQWDLTIEVDGVDQPVRELHLADIREMDGLKDKTDEDLRAFVSRLFVNAKDVKVDATDFDHGKLFGVCSIVRSYYTGLAAKNSQLVGGVVLSQMGIKTE